MPVSMIKTGGRAKVVAVTGTDAVKKHLGALGIVPGTLITMVQTSMGNYIIGVHDSRIGIDAGIAGRVLVNPV